MNVPSRIVVAERYRATVHDDAPDLPAFTKSKVGSDDCHEHSATSRLGENIYLMILLAVYVGPAIAKWYLERYVQNFIVTFVAEHSMRPSNALT